MEDTNTLQEIGSTQIDQNSIEKSSKQKGNFLPILGVLLVVVLVIGAFYYFKIIKPQQNATSTNQTAPSLVSKNPSAYLNPNSGDLYKDIGIRLKEVLK